MMDEYGLPQKTVAVIRGILAQFPAVEKAILYGSRAMGTYRRGSDIDLTLIGDGLNLHVLTDIAGKLEESPIPYQVDLSLWDQIDHPGLREHVLRVGLVFYERHESHRDA